MSDGKDRTQRRVYVLPNELVERIVAFQQQSGLGSEVEAARRLLDDALKQRDTFYTITAKLVEKFSETNILREAARDVLANHPLVNSIVFGNEELRFTLKNAYSVSIDRNCKATVWDENNDLLDLGYEPLPSWASSSHPRRKKPARGNYDLDDDIPF